MIQYTALFDDGQFYLSNGMLIAIQNEGNGLLYITVDINGKMNKPNALGHDLFMFQLIQKGDRSILVPMGAKGTAYEGDALCNPKSTNYLNGLSCTYNALDNLEYFKKLL